MKRIEKYHEAEQKLYEAEEKYRKNFTRENYEEMLTAYREFQVKRYDQDNDGGEIK